MNVLAIGVRLGRDLAGFAPARTLAIALLCMLKSLSEAASLALLIPLLALVSRSPSASAGSAHSDTIAWFTALFGADRAATLVLAVILVVLLMRAAFGFALSRSKTRLHADYVNALRQRLYKAHSRASWLYLARAHHGRDTHALTGQADYVGAGCIYLVDIATAAFTLAVGIGLAFAISPQATGLVLVGLSILVLPLLAFQRRAFADGETVMHTLQDLHERLSGRMSGLKLGKALGCERDLERQFALASTAYRDATVRASDQSHSTNLLYDAGAASVLVCLVLASNQLAAIATIELAALIIVFVRLAPLANGLVGQARALVAMLPDYAAICRMEDEANAEREILPDHVRRMPMRVGLDLRRVSMRYPEAADAWALREVDLHLPAGTSLGIMGRSGAGKSTLADVMAGLVAPTQGEVLIDGEPLRPERRMDWRASISYVTQDAPLFHDTIRNNLRIGAPDASEEDIAACLDAADAKSLVAGLPSGLDTLAGERGIRLSGGERQRLRLASALLRKPSLLILDEALNALNPADESAIIANLRRLVPMTIVVIAHRASSLMWTDRIVVFDQGRILDAGTPSEIAGRGDRIFFEV